jgi:hypothetical protein
MLSAGAGIRANRAPWGEGRVYSRERGEGGTALDKSKLSVQPQGEEIDRPADAVICRVLGELIIRRQMKVLRDLPGLIRFDDPLRAIVEGSVADGNSQSSEARILHFSGYPIFGHYGVTMVVNS